MFTVEGLGKEITILRDEKGADGGTEDLDVETVKDSHFVELDAAVEGSLATKGEEDTIGTLALDDVLKVLWSDGEEVDGVSEGVGGLNGGDVWVDKDGLDIGLLEGLDRLRACCFRDGDNNINCQRNRLNLAICESQ